MERKPREALDDGELAEFEAVEQDILDQHRGHVLLQIERAKQGRIDEMAASEDVTPETRGAKILSRHMHEEMNTSESDDDIPDDIFLELGLTPPERAEVGEDSAEFDPDADIREKRAEAMRQLIREEYFDSSRRYFKTQKSLDRYRFKAKLANDPRFRASTETASEDLKRKIRALEAEIDDLAEESPESHVIVHGYEFRRLVQQVHSHELAETPYVHEHLSKVMDAVEAGKPVLITGHMGSGKTEMARTASTRGLIERRAYEEALSAEIPQEKIDSRVKKIQQEMIDARTQAFRKKLEEAAAQQDKTLSDEMLEAKSRQLAEASVKGDLSTEAEEQLRTEIYSGTIAKLETQHRRGTLGEEFMPYVVSCSIETELRQLLVDETIGTKTTKNGEAIATTAEKVEGPIVKAMLEGRPVILDEINAMSTQVLSGLNDLLIKARPGETYTVQGYGPVPIKPGFCIIGTGNLGAHYIGRNDIDAATKDRFLGAGGIIDYDYLPMSDIEANQDEAEDAKGDEFFHVMIAHLADRRGELYLRGLGNPEDENGEDEPEVIQKLRAIARLAHESQQVFSGKAIGKEVGGSHDKTFIPQLKDFVLSIRGVINILDTWERKGRDDPSFDLDRAVWEIIQGIDPKDQNTMICLACDCGLFPEDKGWKREQMRRDPSDVKTNLSLSDVYEEPIEGVTRDEYGTYDLRRVVDMLYGERPERQFYPGDEIFSEIADEEEIDPLEFQNEIESRLEEYTQAINALEVLYDQCGCNVQQS